MPVYNGAKFLHAAIESVLQQSWQDFEFIIINDGSTDNTEEIIRSYSDYRIRYIQNEGNKGIVYTLNRGIDLAEGKWTARMDADDICHINRFSDQIEYLENNKDVDVLSTTVTLIDEESKDIGVWEDDTFYTSPRSIYNQLPKNNCISHPTIMAKTAVLKEYRYNATQQGSEDYDLWLRLLASGKKIHKLRQPYLLHRIVKTSITRNRQKNVFRHLLETKKTFLKEAKGKDYDRSFILKILLFSKLDVLKAMLKDLKNKYVV